MLGLQSGPLICIKILLTYNFPVLVLLHDPGGESVEVEVGLRLAHNELEDHSYVTSKKMLIILPQLNFCLSNKYAETFTCGRGRNI